MPKKRRGQPQEPPHWNFFSFPTFAGFSVGLFIASILAGVFYVTIGGSSFDVIFLVGAALMGFTLSHGLMSPFARRRGARQRNRQDEEERERRAAVARVAAANAQAEAEAERVGRRRRRRKKAGT